MGEFEWERALWAELDSAEELHQFVLAGEYITRLTHEILPKLAARRRAVVRSMVGRPDMDATKFAESVGTRRTTITRLMYDGRALERKEAASRSLGRTPPSRYS